MTTPSPPVVGPVAPSESCVSSRSEGQAQASGFAPVDWLTGADSLTATMVALALIVVGLQKWFRRTFGRRFVFTDALNCLASGTTPEYARSLFGAPAYGGV